MQPTQLTISTPPTKKKIKMQHTRGSDAISGDTRKALAMLPVDQSAFLGDKMDVSLVRTCIT